MPYDVFETSDGHVIVAVGNDVQFQRFCDYLKRPELAQNALYATNVARIENRLKLTAIIQSILQKKPMDEIIHGLEARKVPVGAIHNIEAALTSDQAKARNMTINMPKENLQKGMVSLLGNPLNLSATPVTYRYSPPTFGENTDEILNKYIKK